MAYYFYRQELVLFLDESSYEYRRVRQRCIRLIVLRNSQPLGYKRAFENLRPDKKNQTIGYGVGPDEDISAIKEQNLEFICPGLGFHLTFSVRSREVIYMCISEESPWAQKTKVLQKFEQTLRLATRQCT